MLLPQNILQLQLHFSCSLHFIAAATWGLQKLGLDGIVGYHYMFLILNVSNSTQIWMKSLQLSRISFGLLWFAQKFIIYANLNEIHPICPDGSNCTQVWMKLFQLPNMIEAVGIFPNVSNCMQNSMKHCILRWLNEAVWSSPKVNKAV